MSLKNLKNIFNLNLIIVFIIFFLDRISKEYVVNLNQKTQIPEIFSSKYLDINLIWNEGIAFGLLSLGQSNLYNLLTLIIFVITFIIIIIAIRNTGFKKYAFLMIVGGAIGNLYDRIIFKAVPDFIDLHVGDFHWFIFNVADIFITIGVIFLILFELIDINKESHESK